MGLQIQGNSGTILEVGATNRAARTELRATEFGVLGSYRKALLSGEIAAGLAGDSEIFQFRWTDATRLCIPQLIQIDGIAGSATAFAAGFGKLDLVPARSWTVDGSGGTSGDLASDAAKLRTSMGSSLLGAVRIASTAALTAGTKTLDTDAIGQFSFAVGTGVSTQYADQVALFEAKQLYPLVLAEEEGFVIRASIPATGTWRFGITVAWTETEAY